MDVSTRKLRPVVSLAMVISGAISGCAGETGDSAEQAPEDITPAFTDPGAQPEPDTVLGTEPEPVLITSEVVENGGAQNSTPAEECAGVSEVAETRVMPQDIVFVIDNSITMGDELQAVSDRINEDLAGVLEAGGIDYRVVLVSKYGPIDEFGLCVGTPLGGHSCEDPEGFDTAGQPLTHGDRFFHFPQLLDGHDPWCLLLDAYAKAPIPPDLLPSFGVPYRPIEFGPDPNDGWRQWLRPDAFKHVVVVSDGQPACNTADGTFTMGDGYETPLIWDSALKTDASLLEPEKYAARFDEAFTSLSAEQFGTPADRNYRFHSIVGLAEKDTATEPYGPDEALVFDSCIEQEQRFTQAPDWVNGRIYQALSRLTGGLRYPICQHQNFDAVFQTLAERIIEKAELSCQWDIPTVPAGQQFDRDKVNVQYTPGAADAVDVLRVESVADCGADGGWYYDNPETPTQLRACATTCEDLRNDNAGQLDVVFGCQTLLKEPK